MDNDEIARRHVTAYLLQRYHQDRLSRHRPRPASRSLFEVLGTVDGRSPRPPSPLNRADLEDWLKRRTRTRCASEIAAWLPARLAAHARDVVLGGIVTETLRRSTRHSTSSPDGSSARTRGCELASLTMPRQARPTDRRRRGRWRAE